MLHRNRPSTAASRRPLHDEDGVTLVELLVSIGMLAIVLTALAGTIVVSLTAVTRSEQEVTATQFVSEVSESLHTGDFVHVGLYADEIGAGTPDAVQWASRLDAAGDFEGGEIVTITGPGAGTRDDRVPTPVVVETRNGVEYRIDRYVTWIDRDGDGNVETKRLTSFASWTDRAGAPRELRFDAERVVEQSEATATNSGTRVIEYRFTPDPVGLDATTGRPTETVTVHVRTNKPTTDGQVEFYAYDPSDGEWDLVRVTMTGGVHAGTGYVTWTATLPASRSLANGGVDVLFTADDVDGQLVSSMATLGTYGGPYDLLTPTPDGTSSGESTPPAADPSPSPSPTTTATIPVEITSKVVSATQLCVNGTTWRTTKNVTVTVTTKGLSQEDGVVRMTYAYYTSQPLKSNGGVDKNAAPNAVADDVLVFVSGSPTAATYTTVIPAGSKIFNPEKFQTVKFNLTASRGDGVLPTDRATDSFTLTTSKACS